MKISKLLTIVSLLIFINIAYAEDYFGNLGISPTATDKFYLICGNGNLKINYKIQNLRSGSPCVQINSEFPSGGVTKACSAGIWSPLITVATGAGAKVFTIKKNPAISGTNAYRITFHCIDQYGYQYVLGGSQVYLLNQ